MSAPEMVIRAYRPRRLLVRVVVAALLATALVWAAFETGRARAGFDFSAARDERRQMMNDLQRLEREKATLRARVAVAERSLQVDQLAWSDLRLLLSDQNEEILALREELEFYRGIVSPADARRGLRVHDVRIEPLEADGAWRVRLVLIQAMQHDRQAQGAARMVVVGTRGGETLRMALSSLGEFPGDGIAYDFRYFQEFDGDILLPQGFVPARIEVELVPRNPREGRVEQAFDWPAS